MFFLLFSFFILFLLLFSFQAGDDDNYDDTSEDLFGFSCFTSNSSQRSDGNLTNIGGDMSKLSTLDEDGLIAQPHKVCSQRI